MVGARLAGAADDAATAELDRLAGQLAAPQRGGEHVERDPLLGAPPDLTVVGTIGDAVVGLAHVVVTGDTARVTRLFTHPDARGVGVGHAMLGLVATEAEQRGCSGLDSYALPGDRDTKNFFESHGMTSRLLVVHRKLGAGS